MSLTLAMAPGVAAATHEVTVFAQVTDRGKVFAVESKGRRTCTLASGGYRELGELDAKGAKTPATRILALLAFELRKNSFDTEQADDEAAILVVCHWGHSAPRPLDQPPESVMERAMMLALVGGAAISATVSDEERRRILTAASDERFFVIVSAYDFVAYSQRGMKDLLWRTQVSVPSHGLSSEQAWPLLTATGARLLGQETRIPRRIEVRVRGILQPVP